MADKRARFSGNNVNELMDYFFGAESEMGLRSAHASIVAMIGSGSHHDRGGRSNSTEADMVRRVDKHKIARYRGIRAALMAIGAHYQSVLYLSHGVSPSAWPPQWRTAFGMASGAVSTLYGQDAVRVAGAVELARMRDAGEALLGEAHAAYDAARNDADPERSKRRLVPARAAGTAARVEVLRAKQRKAAGYE